MSVEIVAYDQSVDFAVAAWLDAKREHSGSDRTYKAYKQAIDAFRQALRQWGGRDVNSEPAAVATAAQLFAKHSDVRDAVSASTHNTRLAILSSFYAYCVKMGYLGGINPITRVERRPVQEYASATPLDAKDIKTRLQAIDRETIQGQRDYALLLIALTTGRRLSEVAGMWWADCDNVNGQVVITWTRTKGGKTMKDKLPVSVSYALAEWQQHFSPGYGGQVWISLSNNQSYGKPLSIRSLSNICKYRLGTSKFHSLRHTFAHLMEDQGAKISVIQYRLGHTNLATTGRYLQAMRSEENEFADALADIFI